MCVNAYRFFQVLLYSYIYNTRAYWYCIVCVYNFDSMYTLINRLMRVVLSLVHTNMTWVKCSYRTASIMRRRQKHLMHCFTVAVHRQQALSRSIACLLVRRTCAEQRSFLQTWFYRSKQLWCHRFPPPFCWCFEIKKNFRCMYTYIVYSIKTYPDQSDWYRYVPYPLTLVHTSHKNAKICAGTSCSSVMH